MTMTAIFVTVHRLFWVHATLASLTFDPSFSATAMKTTFGRGGVLTSRASQLLVQLLVNDGVLASRHYCVEPVETSVLRNNLEVIVTIRLSAQEEDPSLPVRYDINTGRRMCGHSRLVVTSTNTPEVNETLPTIKNSVRYFNRISKDDEPLQLQQQPHYIAKLTTSQLWIVAICSVIIGSMFIVAISLRIRNHIRRVYNDDPTGNRPIGMSPYSGQSFFNNNDLFQRT